MPEDRRFVSRAGEKLAFALEHFRIDPSGLICADLGCHAGGFTDCLLQSGAARVFSVDTSKNILDWNLRNDERVVLMEKTNALHLSLPEPVDLVTVDVGWTRQELIIPVAAGLLRTAASPPVSPAPSLTLRDQDDGEGQRPTTEGAFPPTVITLIKPHYEASDKERIRGKVREEFVDEVVQRTVEQIRRMGYVVSEPVESPIVGSKGKNREFLATVRPAGE